MLVSIFNGILFPAFHKPISQDCLFLEVIKFLFVLFWLCCSAASAVAQYDSSYYVSYEDQLTTRLYFSRKYTSFEYYDKQDDLTLRYAPNTTLNMGVGATYKWATLNLAYGFGFLNANEEKGDTKYLDLQCHIYGRKFLFDVLGQFYKGFYLNDQNLRAVDGNYYTRPDIKVREFGISGQYMFNYKKFSYRAGFLQNEWQKKSAGTMLLGWQLVWGKGEADSTIIPSAISKVAAEGQKQRLTFVDTGPSIGYAYTLVIKQHFFVMGSGAISFAFGSNLSEGAERVRTSSFIPNFIFRAFLGYNDENWAISFTLTNDTVNIATNRTDRTFSLSTGNVRLNFVKRFGIKRDLLKVLH
jgi:Domain of unknown function (DUF4421)